MTRDLPEGMIDAEPTGGWVSEDVADATGDDGAADTVQRYQEEAPDVEVSAEVSQDRSGDPVSEAAVDGAEDADPDLLSDDQASDDQASDDQADR